MNKSGETNKQLKIANICINNQQKHSEIPEKLR